MVAVKKKKKADFQIFVIEMYDIESKSLLQRRPLPGRGALSAVLHVLILVSSCPD